MQISQLNGNPLVMGGEALLDTYYPVGRIYFSTVNVSPASFMGGSWARIQDRFLLCAGTVYAAGTTGGEAEVTLTIPQMPRHYHDIPVVEAAGNVAGTREAYIQYGIWDVTPNYIDNMRTTGEDQPHNNMPPYRAVYAWERVA